MLTRYFKFNILYNIKNCPYRRMKYLPLYWPLYLAFKVIYFMFVSNNNTKIHLSSKNIVYNF